MTRSSSIPRESFAVADWLLAYWTLRINELPTSSADLAFLKELVEIPSVSSERIF